MLSVERWWMFILRTNGRYITSFLSFIVARNIQDQPKEACQGKHAETKKYQDWKVPLKNKWQTDEVAQQCEMQVWILHFQHSTSRQALQNKPIYNYSTFIRGMTQPSYSLSPFIHQIVSEVIRPVARSFWRGVTSISNVYVCEQAGKTRGVWEDAPPGNF